MGVDFMGIDFVRVDLVGLTHQQLLAGCSVSSPKTMYENNIDAALTPKPTNPFNWPSSI